MKKLKSVIAVLICIALLPVLPAFGASAADGEIFVNEPASCAAQLGITEDALNELVGSLYNSVASCLGSINLQSYSIRATSENVELVRDLLMENPKAFNVRGISYNSVGGNIKLFRIFYYDDLETYNAKLEECDAAADALVGDIPSDLPDALKVALAHDRLAVHCEYSQDFADPDYTAYGALVNGRAICQGYAHGLAYLLNRIGIRSYTCPSEELMHVWNIVLIDGVKYHVDLTWDDPLVDVPGRVGHWNLLLSSDSLFCSYPTRHDSYDYDSTPDSALYEDAFWCFSTTQICLLNGKIYYIDNDAKFICSYDYRTNRTRELLDLSSYVWRAGATSYWPDCYARLACYRGKLYFSLPDGVYTFDPVTNSSARFFLPDMSGFSYFSVFGFNVKDNVMTCLASNTPNLRGAHIEYYTYTFPDVTEYEEPAVTGVEHGGVYSGSVTISWTVGEGTLDGSPFDNGGTLTATGSHTLAVVNGDKAVTLTFTLQAAQRRGDVDGDGQITVADALSVLRIAARLANPTQALIAICDIDRDGEITVADALSVLRVAARLATGL